MAIGASQQMLLFLNAIFKYILQWFSRFYRDENTTSHEFQLSAHPGVGITFLDIALYRRYEGELAPLVVTAHNLLQAWIALRRHADLVLKQQAELATRAKTSSTTESTLENGCCWHTIQWCHVLRDTAEQVIVYISTDPFGLTANNSVAQVEAMAKLHNSGKNSGSALHHIPNLLRRRHKPNDHFWESERLYCPDFIWADAVAQHSQRCLRILWKQHNKFHQHQHANPSTLLLDGLLHDDIPARLTQFKAATEATASLTQRLYLIKCEYRQPYRAYLEAHQAVERAPSVALVQEYQRIATSGSTVYKKRNEDEEALDDPHAKQRLQQLLHAPQLVQALAIAQKLEEYERDMLQALHGFTELAQRGWMVRPSAVTEDSNIPYHWLPSALRVLTRTILMVSDGNGDDDTYVGIQSLILELEEASERSSTSSTTATSLSMSNFCATLTLLANLTTHRDAWIGERRLELPNCQEWDAELWLCQYQDWRTLTDRQSELLREVVPSEIRQAELRASLALSTPQSLGVVLQRLDVIAEEQKQLWKILCDRWKSVCERELGLRVTDVVPPPRELVFIEAQQRGSSTNDSSALGIFDTVLNMTGLLPV